ncbi:TonB-dependent receptor [Glaciecola sp. 1036]|uniref:TonB-dependent receptor n=1 Tax=Alteromonadaceae TaxID=72275 RepID=UPI003D0078AF
MKYFNKEVMTLTSTLVAVMGMSGSAYALQQNTDSEVSEQLKKEQTEETAENEQQQDEEVEVILVEGVRGVDLKARDLERGKDGYSSIIAADDLGNFVDPNVAEALRRLPGVTLQRSEGEGKFVSVRGLGPGFVSVNINGSEMSGVGEDRKVGLDAIPADILGSIEVLKTLTADQDLNSIGGTVNVKAISAFDRGRDTLKVRIQDAYSDFREEHSPKLSIDGTSLFSDRTFGIGFALSTENRKTQVDEIRHHSSNEMKFYQADISASDGPEILAPSQLEYRREIANRQRRAASLNLEYRPNDNAYYYVKGNLTKYTDEDIALREFYDFQDAGSVGNGEIAYVNSETKEFVLTDIDIFHQYFIQGGDTTTRNFSIGGENTIAESWVIDYEYAQSKSRDESLNDRRVQFRERDNIVFGQGLKDNIIGYAISPEEAAALGGFAYDPNDSIFGTSGSGDASNLSNWQFDNLFLEDGVREDKIKNGNLNITRHFYDSSFLNYIKVGAAFSERTHFRDKNRSSFEPDVADCGGSQTCIDVVNSVHSDYASAIPENSNFFYPFVNRDQIEFMVDNASITREGSTRNEVSIDSTKEDYTLNEDTKAAYIMAQFQFGDDMTVITGVRYAETEFSSTGFLSLENDDFEFNGVDQGSLDIAVPLSEASIEYSEFYPSVHLKYEPHEDVLVRGAIWTSFTRPSFKQARGFAKFDSDIELCPPGSDDCDDSQGSANIRQLQDYTLGPNNTLDVGNPNLIAMTSVNYDASIGWYADDDLFLEAAIFYKDIDNFIVDVSGIPRSIQDLPLSLPVSQITEFVIPQDLFLNDINITLNGEDAKVLGMELSYNQYFENGFFIQSNLTLLDSKAQLDRTVRGDKVPLPDQADLTANLSIGWENETYSARVIGNYRSEILEEVGACPEGTPISAVRDCKIWADRYQDAINTLDFKFRAKITKQLNVYIDAINITDESDLRYFEGNELSGGNILYQKETYGRTFQLGMDYKFY